MVRWGRLPRLLWCGQRDVYVFGACCEESTVDKRVSRWTGMLSNHLSHVTFSGD